MGTGLMPLGDQIGGRLSEKTNAVQMTLVLFFLGILVTFSEPGINSLQIVGSLFNSEDHNPASGVSLLLTLLHKERSLQLLFAVAVGVGLAAVVGIWRVQLRLGV